ncbi:MAG: hypothetical protein LBT92_03055 [Rickettsiales bacterium]|jgi:uncharacterized membrane protein YhaH (DUF805 family)|nr:hypothetical protein [Rickettsiales bacterium]
MAEMKQSRRGRKFFRPRPAGNRGLISFFFSFSGSISKELYIGSSLAMCVIFVVLAAVFGTLMPEEGAQPTLGTQIALWAAGLPALLAAESCIALGYKRSHAMGMSGFYSLVGTTYMQAFFKFFRADRDNPSDGAYAYKFSRFKAVGAIVNKNWATRIIYLALMASPAFLAFKADPEFASNLPGLYMLFCVNALQVFFAMTGFAKRYYAPIVKVLSFAGYTYLIMMLSYAFAQYKFYMALSQIALR